MKLISLNVSLFDDNNSHLTKFLKEQNADIVCLQEVTRPLEKSTDEKYLSKDAIDSSTIDLKYFFYGAEKIMDDFEIKDFHGKETFSFKFGGSLELGKYTKSKYKIVKAQNIFLENSLSYSLDLSSWEEEQSRSVLVTDHDLNGKKLRVLNYHGIWTRNKLGNAKTLSANKTICKLALNTGSEVIICGDFNLFPNTPSMKVFEKDFTSLVDKFGVKTTRPATNELSSFKRNVVDYIWVSKGLNVKNFEVVDTDVSDHFPLVLDFEF